MHMRRVIWPDADEILNISITGDYYSLHCPYRTVNVVKSKSLSH